MKSIHEVHELYGRPDRSLSEIAMVEICETCS